MKAGKSFIILAASFAPALGLAEYASARGEVEWVGIPGGEFLMGSDLYGERPRHSVTVETFELARTLVTNRQYRACVEAGVCMPPKKSCIADKLKGDDQPVVCVNWDQAKTFCEWIGGRLPSEAEWEYAARNLGKDVQYPWGNGDDSCRRAVTSDSEGDGCGRRSTWPVCSKPLGNTKQGLCDMLGNAEQWLQDARHDSYEGAPTDGSAWEGREGIDNRIVRGAGWDQSLPIHATMSRNHAFLESKSLSFRPARGGRSAGSGQDAAAVKAAGGGKAKSPLRQEEWYIYWLERKDAGAFQAVSRAADQGIVLAKYYQALMLRDGLGCKQDVARALYLLSIVDLQAADDIDLPSGFKEESAKVLQEVAQRIPEKDRANLFFQLGDSYYLGKAQAKKDLRYAFHFYRAAADLGHAEAQNDIGVMYHKGEVSNGKDLKEAYRWYFKASRQGFALAGENAKDIRPSLSPMDIAEAEDNKIEVQRLAVVAEQERTAAAQEQKVLEAALLRAERAAADKRHIFVIVLGVLLNVPVLLILMKIRDFEVDQTGEGAAWPDNFGGWVKAFLGSLELADPRKMRLMALGRLVVAPFVLTALISPIFFFNKAGHVGRQEGMLVFIVILLSVKLALASVFELLTGRSFWTVVGFLESLEGWKQSVIKVVVVYDLFMFIYTLLWQALWKSFGIA